MKARALLHRATGLALSERAVAQAVTRRMQALGVDSAKAYDALLAGAEMNALIEQVVVPESWMFRDPEAFAAAAAFVQERCSRVNPVRILSLPCAGGEEPYSMAMALEDAGVAGSCYRIDAVDLSEVALARARAGRYSRNAFRGRETEFRDRHFTGIDGQFQIKPALQRRVSFRQGNILTLEPQGGRYDVIFCRNLLIYFDEPAVAAAIARLDALMADDGLLLAGYAEVPAFVRQGFQTVRAPGAFALSKAAAAPAAAAPAPLPLLRPVRAAAPPRKAPVKAGPAKSAPPAPDLPFQLAGARRLADRGELAAAAKACLAVLDAASDTAPECAEAYFILGMVSECGGDVSAAENNYRRCIYLQPGHYEALCHLALLCEHKGEMAQADTFKQRAARIYSRRAGSTV